MDTETLNKANTLRKEIKEIEDIISCLRKYAFSQDQPHVVVEIRVDQSRDKIAEFDRAQSFDYTHYIHKDLEKRLNILREQFRNL